MTRKTDDMGIPLECLKPLCGPGDHHPLCEHHGNVVMQPRDVTAHQFALRKAHELIEQDGQQIGDVSDGCGEDPGGADA
jgi:hypothetical protein